MNPQKLKFGIIGFGIFGQKRLIPGFKNASNAELIAISKRSLSVAQEKAKEFNIPFAYDNIDSLLANDEIDAVFIATPNSFHKSDCLRAARAHKHILVEKPMALNVSECQDMIRVCQENHVKLMIAHCMRFNPTVLRMKEIVEQGHLGEIISANAQYCFNGAASKRDWLLDHALAGGGPIVDVGVHCIDNLRFITNADVTKVKSIFRHHMKGNVESSANILLEFDRGLLGTINVSFEADFYTTLEIVGTQGSIRAEQYNLIDTDVELRIRKKYSLQKEIIHNNNCYAAEIEAFASAIMNHSEAPISPKEGLYNQRILDQILKQDE